MNDYNAHWTQILSKEGTQNVDFITSLDENGINHFLTKHHEIDSKVYKKVFEKTFNTQSDTRKFVVELEVKAPIEIQFPPFSPGPLSNVFSDTKNWVKLDNKHRGPELRTDSSNLHIYCKQVNVKLTWPKFSGGGTWSMSLDPFDVYAQSKIQLNQDDDGYYCTIIPQKLQFDIPRAQAIATQLSKAMENAPAEIRAEYDECQEKITDLFIIAANIAATEQTPKLVRNIQVPVPVIADKPVMPALLDLSNNILSIGFGLDKVKLEQKEGEHMSKNLIDLESALNKDVKTSGGLLKLISKNYKDQEHFEDIEFLSEEEVQKKLVNSELYIAEQENILADFNALNDDDSYLQKIAAVADAYAIGINEYFFDTVVNSVIPGPKHKCSGWLNLKLAKGRVCHWSKFKNPDVQIKPTGKLVGGVNIDIGGAIEACVKKFYDCSWEWKCSKLSLAVKGRPEIKVELKRSKGVRMLAQLDGKLRLDTNLPWPFNKIVRGFSGVIWTFVKGFINIILAALSFVVIKPEFKLPQMETRIKLRNFTPFYFERPESDGVTGSKTRFIGYKGGITAGR